MLESSCVYIDEVELILKEANQMKIENGYSKFLQSIKQTQSQKAEEKTDKKNISEEKEALVQVNISEEAKALLEADEAEFSARVDEIKLQIQNGEYEINPDKISEGLLKTIESQKEF